MDLRLIEICARPARGAACSNCIERKRERERERERGRERNSERKRERKRERKSQRERGRERAREREREREKEDEHYINMQSSLSISHKPYLNTSMESTYTYRKRD